MNSLRKIAKTPHDTDQSIPLKFITPTLCALFLAFLSACGGSDSSTPETPATTGGTTTGGTVTDDGSTGGVATPANTTGTTTDTGTSGEGTIAASPEALMSFMLTSTTSLIGAPTHFWLCTFSDNSVPTYFKFDEGADATDPSFNPLVILGDGRDAVLDGDPRSFDNLQDSINNVVDIEAEVTSSDSMMLNIRSSGITPESAFDLTTIRVGPGRVFSADSSLDNLKLICTETDVGENVFLAPG